MAGVRRRELPGFRRRIGVVFQDFRLLDHLTALDNVGLPLRVAGVDERTIRAHVGELLAWVGLADRLEAKPPTLSGGEKQRVAIARAVITRPQILLADEPTGNVDDQMALKLLHLFGQLHKAGTTVLIATHNQPLVDRLGHPQLRLDGGRVTAEQPRAA
jgi:cell division transport system ATP-binding protein